jgi:dTDP-4-dehydrorhamnose reductase
MLGQDLQLCLERAAYHVQGFDLPELDITKSKEVLTCLNTTKPDVVINCAAYTAVDKAESEPAVTFAVNRDGSSNLAKTCRRLDIPLVHLSTDYVFDGRGQRPYREDDPANPLSVYGRSKWEGEEAIRARLPKHIIVRTSWLYGIHGKNFAKTILRLAKEQKELRVVSDQYGCPTWTGDLADALVAMAGQIHENPIPIPWGTYHFCGNGFTTWYDFAKAILKQGRLFENLRAVPVVPITTANYPTPAQRPKWSVLDCSKIKRAFNVQQRPWEEGLEAMLEEFNNAGS